MSSAVSSTASITLLISGVSVSMSPSVSSLSPAAYTPVMVCYSTPQQQQQQQQQTWFAALLASSCLQQTTNNHTHSISIFTTNLDLCLLISGGGLGAYLLS